MKFCTHCGNELLDEAVICPKCGYSTAEGANAPVPVTPMPLAAPITQVQPAPVKAKKPGYSPLSIVGFILAIIIPFAGLICSIIAYKNACFDENKRSKSFSKTGIIIASIFFTAHLVCQIVSLVLEAKGMGSVNYWRYWWDLLFG